VFFGELVEESADGGGFGEGVVSELFPELGWEVDADDLHARLRGRSRCSHGLAAYIIKWAGVDAV
jgi:hypothetical protein